MYLPQSAHQGGLHRAFRADGTITTGGTSQLILPVAPTRCMLLIQNISSSAMYLDHGPPRMTVTISGGVVTACSVLNGGFGYTMAPSIQFDGGFQPYIASATFNGIGLHGTRPPSGLATQGDITGNTTYNRPAKAHCVLSGGVVTSVVIDDGGFGYINPPMAILKNSDYDPFGCADPAHNSGSGIYLAALGGSYYINGSACHTDQCALYCSSSSAAFTVEYMA